MSAVTTSAIETIHVRLLDESVDVWRPVQALALGGNRYRVVDQVVPDDEIWEFRPGDEVTTATRRTERDDFLAAISRTGQQRRTR
jgi:hypothetical protein